jgi:uncharacterized surface protein with fasciclin (FAS1) repeats
MSLAWLATLAAALTATLSAPHTAPKGAAGCVGIPRSLAAQPVADAIAEVPSLSTLASGFSEAGLTAELNNRPRVTVFAPVNDALSKLSGPVTLDASILRYHVVPERLTPDRLVGTHRTLQGGRLSVVRADSHVRVNATAGLICTRVEAANGNVYLIDALLTPPR